MRMDPSIILSGRAPDIVGSLARGAQAAGMVGDVEHQTGFRNALRDYGAGLVRGQEASQNALAAYDPQMVMGVQNTQHKMQDRESRLRLAYQQASQQAAEHTARMSEHQRKQEEDQLERAISMATQAQTPEQWDRVMSGFGEVGAPYVGRFEDRDMLIAGALGVRDALGMNAQADRAPVTVAPGHTVFDRNTNQPIWQAPERPQDEATAAFNTLDQRARAAGLHPGTPEYQQFMLEGGRGNGLELVVGPDGSVQFRQGGAGAQPNVHLPPPSAAGATQFEGAESAFGAVGAGAALANRVSDILTGAVPFPRTLEAQRDFAVFGESLINAFASAYGRQPPSWLLQNIAELTPRAGKLFEGPQQAQSKMRSMVRDLTTRRNSLISVAEGSGDPQFLDEVRRQVLGIDATIGQINQALDAFQPGERGGQTGAGIQWSIED